ncbi:MAG: ABC transporter permease, partial [Planctomycetota bacterium]
GYLVNGWTATSIVGSGQGGGKSVVLTLIVDFDIVLKCMGLSVAMGIIGGLYPAFTTFRAKPLEILR